MAEAPSTTVAERPVTSPASGTDGTGTPAASPAGDQAARPSTTGPAAEPGTNPTGESASTSEAGQSSESGASSEAGTSTGPAGGPTLADWTQWAKDKSPDQIRAALLSDRRTAGIVGEMSHRIAQDLAKTQRENDAAIEAQNKRIRERKALRDSNPAAYVALQKQEEELQELIADVRGEAHAAVTVFASKLPEAIQQKLSGKAYAGEWQQGFGEYLQETFNETLNHELTSQLQPAIDKAVKEARDKWEKEELPAYRKTVLAEVNAPRRGAEGNTPEVDAGSTTSSSGSGPVDQTEWEANRDSRAWRLANKSRVDAGIKQGLITS